jgi:hypothetical protein
MKRNFRILIYPLMVMGVFLTLTSSCKKSDDSNNPTPTLSKKVQTIQYSNGNTETFEYNSDGKLSKDTETGPVTNNDYTDTYTYSGNIITETSTSLNAGTTHTLAITLNSQGYISNITEVYANQNYVETFEYDNSGYLTKETETPEGNDIYTYTYTYTNGNRISETVAKNSSNVQTVYYEYYLDKENALSAEKLVGECYSGKSDKNLIKRITYSSSEIESYTYEYDQDNYVTKQTTTAVDGTTSWKTYSYK